MKSKKSHLFGISFLTLAFCASGLSAATVTWTGAAADNDFGTALNWNSSAGGNAVPMQADTVVIGNGVTINRAGPAPRFAGFTLGAGSVFNYTAIGDIQQTLNINGTVRAVGTQNALGIQPGVIVNFGVLGLYDATQSSNDITFYSNNNGITLNIAFDLASAAAGTLVTRDIFIWDGGTNQPVALANGTTKSFTEAGGKTFTTLADNTVPTNPGEVSLFKTLNTGAGANGYRIQYITVLPEPTSAALLGLAGLGMLVRRRK